MKKVLLFLVLSMVITAGVFAQDDFKRSWIGGEIGILGGGARFEFMITPWMSAGANVYYSYLFFTSDFGINAVARFYPLAGINEKWRVKPGLFAEIGLGFGINYGFVDLEEEYTLWGYRYVGGVYNIWTQTTGFQIAPAVGWKVDFGKPGGFYLSPGVKLPITIGSQKAVLFPDDYKSQIGATVSTVVFIGLGAGF